MEHIHDAHLEHSILGSILSSGDALDYAQDLDESHFVFPDHRRIFAAARAIHMAGGTPTPELVASRLPDDPIGERSPIQYLRELVLNGAGVFMLEQHAAQLVDLSRRRGIRDLAAELDRAANDVGGTSTDALVELVERRLYAMQTRETAERFVAMGEAMDEALRLAAKAYDRQDGLAGLSSGFPSLDRKMGGLAKSDLIILAGRPSMGKSALAMNIARHVAECGTPAGVFSLEMGHEQLATRLLGEETGISSSVIRRGAFNEADYASLAEAARKFLHLPIHIDQSGGLAISQLVLRARRAKRQHGIGLIVVDYLQLLHGSRSRGGRENRAQELGEITTGLKALAKELDLPVIALSQLSREVEKRDDKRPMLADLRESGSIEQDADVVLFVYREEYYLARTRPDENTTAFIDWEAAMAAAKGNAEVIIGKQRNGPLGTVDLRFDGGRTSFRDTKIQTDQYEAAF